LSICNEKNGIQKTMDHFFGSQTEGNTSSVVVLTTMTIFLGLMIINDYNK